ncbi:MAG: bifunctional DNA-formamidopyrimidine glycosylase/DNA-(apurinic or apyrimidinic site) lyase [candidate division WOR-3 bacterium]|nr:bifunctional DNA-formamidopyrimidine glycosylase/DNA-(apurinic or apyrimidinic site) lyase [candidate division WOR-3 bacterium]MCX7837559.1 bifunctional DNA-formamidopyrimidine glycosylase/DNA-(apurinic or apyrimidinic site) lyase [candidate division WOR-3 bacterium]MDW8114054.1 bifunctional DNA-formamidopyrimidine glycosylase/DNA-(apurinic or apyrimidinic site) lyase [candidate division WOR-3 bacterium]
MPELPEVETIKRELKSFLINKSFIGVKLENKKIIGYPNPRDFLKNIINKKILDIDRKGKFLIFKLSNNYNLTFHLRLSGRLIYKENPKEEVKYTRIMFLLNKGSLVFSEPRLLGRVYLYHDNKLPESLSLLKNLGKEPIMSEFNFQYLKEKIKNRNSSIKSLLLDQKIASGVGNIYSDEALFCAQIHPKRKGSSLKDEEIKKLVRCLKKVIKRAIKEKGTSISDYLRPNGKEGSFQNYLKIFKREGENCFRCNEKIMRIKINNRSSYFCPGCQKEV